MSQANPNIDKIVLEAVKSRVRLALAEELVNAKKHLDERIPELITDVIVEISNSKELESLNEHIHFHVHTK